MIASSPRRAAAAIALTVGLVVSACGASESELPSFDNPVKGDHVDPDSFLKALRSSFRAGSTAMVSFDVRGGIGLQGGGAVRYTADGMDASLRLDDWQVEGASIDIRTVRGVTYMRVPESRGLWVSLDGSGTPGADLAKEADPRQAIDDLRDTIEEVRFGGVERIDAVASRRFQVVTRPASTQGAGSDGAGQPTVAQYWFDENGRVVRRQTELAQAGSATFTWTGWGKPVKIVRPNADTVITMERLEQLRQDQAGSSQ
jgi:hypothetical protein